MSDDNMIHIKGRFLELFSELDEVEIDYIDKWISSHSYKKDLQNKSALNSSEKCLIKIANTIKKLVPFEAELPSENIVPPTIGNLADCTKESTCHIDEFLYDHNTVEDLTQQGKIKRHYCVDCNSRNIKELTLISHSLSRQTLLYIFKFLLPKDLENKQFLDLGSRLGAVIYGAYYLSNATNIVGVEINKECCDLQDTIVGQYSMDNDRIKIINADILDRSDIVQNSDIIVINCLDHFVNVDIHREIWYFLKKHLKKGSYVITVRSIADTLIALDMFEELSNWLSISKPNQMENEMFFDMEDCNEIYLYTVN
ncbi:uncharacterized protein LOC131854880 [Achroia grisella]|uniref:uncharacterized protein LOC131854880 n=1 Tax=Achroia grisella TaxID=688607 RepID=UPI0027D222A0|nr:uncharacterized protein LOC131854880 [Achroia grisella]